MTCSVAPWPPSVTFVCVELSYMTASAMPEDSDAKLEDVEADSELMPVDNELIPLDSELTPADSELVWPAKLNLPEWTRRRSLVQT
ncbi:hypothetical protein [Candidatus Burkholderia verschuerenii]|uniref:hypothetical protein n=1 Tax=Candidatus Burkholderia verschuerenii TaxID=242163 RepID=UPI0018DE519E|nr:hypothetical protein [Candidatus Burkholderia verschuerenii]